MNNYPIPEDEIFDLRDFPKIYAFSTHDEGSQKLPPKNTPMFPNSNLISSSDSLSKWDMNKDTL